MFYTVYKITNKLNGKTYIGSHKTEKLDDGYMGSGKYLKRSIEKNGLENFTKEILHVYDNSEEMFAKEAELVNEDYLSEGNTYNLKIGGWGGFDYLNSIKNNPTHTKEHYNKIKEKAKTTMIKKYGVEFSSQIEKNKKISSDRLKRFHEEGRINYNTFQGRKHSEESKRKMSEARKKRNQQNSPP